MTAKGIGRKPVLLFGGIGLALSVWPAWWLMHHPSTLAIASGQLIFAVFYGVYVSQMPAVAPEMLPAEVRVSGTAIGYNLCIGTLGGTTPLVATYLTSRTGDDFAPVYYSDSGGAGADRGGDHEGDGAFDSLHPLQTTGRRKFCVNRFAFRRVRNKLSVVGSFFMYVACRDR